jgi:hypothetical protein
MSSSSVRSASAFKASVRSTPAWIAAFTSPSSEASAPGLTTSSSATRCSAAFSPNPTSAQVTSRSNGAKDFILGCIAIVRAALPGVSIEVCMDSAFFSDEIVGSLDAAGVEYTVSVPFERFTDLKARIEARRF